MSDTRLRELERRWNETGSPDDEAAYLLERVRVGDLTQERLELAAYCGHEGARRLTSTTAVDDSEAWIAGLARFGHAVVVEAAIEAARCLCDGADEWTADRLRSVIVDACTWHACPCDEHSLKLLFHLYLGGLPEGRHRDPGADLVSAVSCGNVDQAAHFLKSLVSQCGSTETLIKKKIKFELSSRCLS
ncbi:MAG: hypothetical protein KIT58_00955 [Planctomycetota bacterium]|nr:hypothetical protein [Planctomycetota bacterium]